MSYIKKIANKNKIPYMKVKKIFLDDFGTYLASNGDGTFIIKGKNSCIDVNQEGNINISGSTSVTIQGKNLDFSELPDRYIREDGISWNAVVNNSKVIAAIPIRIKGQKVYIPCLDVDID